MVEPVGEQRLWAAVIDRAWADINNRYDGLLNKGVGDQVASWIGTPNFREVCELAGLEPSSAEAKFREALRAPRTVRKPRRAA